MNVWPRLIKTHRLQCTSWGLFLFHSPLISRAQHPKIIKTHSVSQLTRYNAYHVVFYLHTVDSTGDFTHMSFLVCVCVCVYSRAQCAQENTLVRAQCVSVLTPTIVYTTIQVSEKQTRALLGDAFASLLFNSLRLLRDQHAGPKSFCPLLWRISWHILRYFFLQEVRVKEAKRTCPPNDISSRWAQETVRWRYLVPEFGSWLVRGMSQKSRACHL